ncbi:MAG TPA: ABC transporter ATP-binding protein [Victivallales bacterium]|nr:ABC transporter ATP-binding protein [Victivallales bacterium]HPO91535.1 ABC transporter ATP-binding protein [Victivallales bacterium]HRR27878.1 ABC transporter ATP-binding protein [Victivallales bacterium]
MEKNGGKMTYSEFPVVLESVSKSFKQGENRVNALKNISVKIKEGDFVAIMGASGSGKSTFLHVLAGLTRADSGKIFIASKDINLLSDRELTIFRRKNIGIVFQAYNLIPTLSAKDNILLPYYVDLRNSNKIPPEFDELVEKLGLRNRLHHCPDAMSGGEQQRVAIARALINQPQIVLADEPTGSLDSVNGQEFCKLLKKFSDEDKKTIIVVTHEPSVAIWARRIMILKDGEFIDEFDSSSFHDVHLLAARYQESLEKKCA